MLYTLSNDDMRFSILDNSDPANTDYHYIPLIFLESFVAPAILCVQLLHFILYCEFIHVVVSVVLRQCNF